MAKCERPILERFTLLEIEVESVVLSLVSLLSAFGFCQNALAQSPTEIDVSWKGKFPVRIFTVGLNEDEDVDWV
jgi:hypothetical protein